MRLAVQRSSGRSACKGIAKRPDAVSLRLSQLWPPALIFAMARRALIAALSVLGLFLVGTVVVLSSISIFLSIPASTYIYETDVPADAWTGNITDAPHKEHVPRIIHQTWKTEILPDRWEPVSKTCRDLMPDYEYMLWTDKASDDFIAEHYSWFLPTFRGYTYPIQRADAIRYFVLHHYGGAYLDLDVGCKRRLDPLLTYPITLPKTIPVGVSNDLMFAAKGHPFMTQTIHALMPFDINYIINYPTVMFSTGPMFLSAQLSLFASRNPSLASEVRVLSKPLYGKNAKPEEAPHAFFTHHYGSSWHADDAGFITFLGKYGRILMYVGLALLVFGLYRLFRTRTPGSPARRRGGYTLLLPRVIEDQNGRTVLDLGLFSVPMPGTVPLSPSSHDLPMLPLNRRARNQGVLFFLPAILQPSSRRNSGVGSRSRSPPPTSEKEDLENAGLIAPGLGHASGSRRGSDARSRSRPATPEPVAPPPYPSAQGPSTPLRTGSARWTASGAEWAPWSPAVDR